MNNLKKIFAVFITFMIINNTVALPFNNDNLITYDVAKKALYTHHNDDYTVKVRIPGEQWRDLYEYNVEVDLDKPQNASMVYFDMLGTVEVAIKKNNGDVSRVEVRPQSTGIKATVKDNTAFFTLHKPTKISVEFNGDRLHNMHLFANELEKSSPNSKDDNVMWFDAGIHKPKEGNSFNIPSNTTVYIAGGALLQGKILIHNAENVRILGPGIIDNPERGIEVTMSKNVIIDGPIIRNPKHYTVFCGQSSDLIIRNFKTFSAKPWSDGIDMMSCSNVHIDDVFLRTSDDAIAVYGHRWEYSGNVKNIKVTNSTLWADVAHPINIGIHGSHKKPETIEKLTFKNIDILAHDEDDPNYQGAMAISCGDDNLIRNVLFEDIRLDNIEEGMLFNFRSLFNEKYSLAPCRGVENITLRNVHYQGPMISPSVISGYSASRAVDGVYLDNVSVNGKQVTKGDLVIGDYVNNLKIKKLSLKP
ncbi:MAG: glycosyl hydrolase family 28 protein [Colwellia sp.]